MGASLIRRGAATSVVLFLLLAGAAQATSFEIPPRPAAVDGLDPALAAIARGDGPAATAARAGLDFAGQRVRVVVEPAAGDPAAARAAVTAVGGEVQIVAGGLIEALVPVGRLVDLAGRASVEQVSRPALMRPAGLVSEGVEVSGASDWHADGLTGAGVRVAVIDIGFAGAEEAIADGDLPAGTVMKDLCDGGMDSSFHGTPVAEIVHQMAPDAELHLICVSSQVGLAAAVEYAAEQGITVINHSVGWFNTARGDGSGGPGTPDAFAAEARALGITWINSAGNEALTHWGGDYQPGGPTGDFHAFAPGDITNDALIAAGTTACAALKWDAWPATSEDFDLLLVDRTTNTVVAESYIDQSSDPKTPTELLCFFNDGATRPFGLVIQRYSAVTTPRMDLFFIGGSGLEHPVEFGSVAEPATSPAVMAVGAACWSSGVRQPFSSWGSPWSPKPEILGPDGVSSPVYGVGDDCDWNGFRGTSAAAPHVAGAAALLRQWKPELSPSEVIATLQTGTTDAGLLRLPPRDSVGEPPAVDVAPVLAGSGLRYVHATPGRWTPGIATPVGATWARCNAAGDDCVNVPGATDLAYALGPDDVGSTLVATVTATNASGSTSTTTGPSSVILPAPPVASALPEVSGTPSVGSVLTAGPGTWSGDPSQFHYQWRSCNDFGGGCVDIDGATTNQYTPTGCDADRTVRVAVRAVNGGGTGVATSPAEWVDGTGPCPPEPPDNGGGGGGGGGGAPTGSTTTPTAPSQPTAPSAQLPASPSAPGPQTTAPQQTPTAAGALRGLLGRTLSRSALLRSGRARTTFSAPGAGVLTLRWTASGRTIATGRATCRAAGRCAITLRLTHAGRRTLKRTGAVQVRATARFAPTNGPAVQRTQRVTLPAGR